MNVRGQLFCRIPAGINTPNTYLVCGLIRTDKPLSDETIHTFSGDVTMYASRNVEKHSRGNGLDGIMTTPIWNLNLKED